MAHPRDLPRTAPGLSRPVRMAPIVLVLGLVLSGLGIPLGSAHALPPPPTGRSMETPAVDAPTAAAPSLSAPPTADNGPWTNITSRMISAPSAREGAMMAYDPAIGKVVLFGGYTGARTSQETWEYSRGHWVNISSTLTISPPPRQRGGLVYDSTDGELLLFGGHDGAIYLNDTWAFNGTAWNPISTTVAPIPREDMMMVDDPVDQYVLLFGGEVLSGHLLSDTWTFHAGVWTNLTSSLSTSPPAREEGGFAWDGSDGYALLYSGKAGATGLWNDTWTFSGGAWTNRTTTVGTQPPKRENPSLAYDPSDGFVLLFGGLRYPNPFNDSWTFSDGQWSELPAAPSPSPRFDSAFTYDPNGGLGYVLLFGGQSSPSQVNSTLGDTWTFKTPLKVFVHSSAPTIDLGESTGLAISVTGGYAPYVFYEWSGLPTPCAGGNVSSFSCTPNVTGMFPLAANVTDSGGFNGTSSPFVLRVNPDPTVAVNASTKSGDVPLTVAFTSLATGGTAPLTYYWLFGDGKNSTIPSPSHTYNKSQIYDATLTVTDARNYTATANLTIHALPPAVALSATISALPTRGPAPLLVDFGVVASGGVQSYAYAWDFGAGGGTSTSASTSFDYTTPGTYEADVVVTDSGQETVAEYTNITVLVPTPLVATGTADVVSGTAPFKVNFTGTASGGRGPYQYSWAFGSSGTGTGASPSYTFTSAGVYEAVLAVTDANGTRATASPIKITVLAPLAASFVATVGVPYCAQGAGEAPVTVVAAVDGGSGGTTFAWSFPNGVGSGVNATTTVGAGANWTIQLTAKDSELHTATSTQSISVPAIGCSTAAGGTTGHASYLILALIVLVAAVILVELVMVLRRQKKTN